MGKKFKLAVSQVSTSKPQCPLLIYPTLFPFFILFSKKNAMSRKKTLVGYAPAQRKGVKVKQGGRDPRVQRQWVWGRGAF